MTKSEIIELLTELGQRLYQKGVQGEMYVVRGTAMALAYDVSRVTRDIDAVFIPKTAIYEEALSLARDRVLPEKWLNDAVKGFLVGDDKNKIPVLDVPGLRVMAASPRYMFAMKCLASRMGDEEDIRHLLKLLKIRSLQEALDIIESVYRDHPIPARTQFLLEEIFLSANDRSPDLRP